MKKYKKIISITLLLMMIFLLTPVITFYLSYNYLLPGGYFFEDKLFKSFHMDKKLKDKHTDIIFIGSSRTQNHISTTIFKQNGYNIYTYARPSMELSDFPFPVKKSIDIKPKYIVLVIDIKDLFKDIDIRFPTYYDRKFYDNTFKYGTINEFVSENFRMKDLFRQSKEYFKNEFLGLNSKYLNSYDINLTKEIDCNIVHWRADVGERRVALCDNGNGIVFDNRVLSVEKSVKNYSTYMINQSKINLLNKLILQIKNSGIFPIVIFEPTGFNSEIRYVKNDFKRIINSEILHLVNFKVDMYALWADKSHFNVHGRREYTEQLIKEFIKLSKRNIS